MKNSDEQRKGNGQACDTVAVFFKATPQTPHPPKYSIRINADDFNPDLHEQAKQEIHPTDEGTVVENAVVSKSSSEETDEVTGEVLESYSKKELQHFLEANAVEFSMSENKEDVLAKAKAFLVSKSQ